MKRILLFFIVLSSNLCANNDWNCANHDQFDNVKMVLHCLETKNIDDKIFWYEKWNSNFESGFNEDTKDLKKSDIKLRKSLRARGYSDLGGLYEDKRNYVLAFKNYEIAAKQGNSFAQYNLARFYMLGQGTLVDYEQAYAWFKTSLYQGTSEEAEKASSNIINKLETYQLSKYTCDSCFVRAKNLAKKYIAEYVS